MAIFKQTFKPKLIYVYRINDSAHKGILKVGDASCDDPDYFSLAPNSKSLNEAAKARIRQQTQTAGISFELLYTEKTAYFKNKQLLVFQDHEVHDILERSGIKHKYFDEEHKANEWFYTDLETVKKAIQAVKDRRKSLNANEVSKDKNPIIFRPEQREAIDKTVKQFTKKNSSHQMLWNAKMRFGKTLSALQVTKECDFRRTLILTHRPVVDEGWFEDYSKIFYDRPEFLYGSKIRGSSLEDCEKIYNKSKTGSYIYFASIQDMRGSKIVGGKFSKNREIFDIDWNLVIIDEAHEGTQTELGQKVIATCIKPETRVLNLSGTPFNLMDDFKQDEIYTWDYVMEQRAKRDWDKLHKGDPNPYACLPQLNIFTYDLGKLYPDFADADIAFNFHEFFRVDDKEIFVHEADIKRFLDLLVKKDKESNYPYSTQEYRDNFRHSLWMVPGVKSAKALSKLLKEHPVFSTFNIANVAGAGDEEVPSDNALMLVNKAIGKHPEDSYSITLSCGRLTTGVSVRSWTACFMLAGTYSTSASSYMQTIFRVQTPAIIGGKQKEECYVFDFAPDRTLKVVAETAKISAKAGHTTSDDRKILGNFLNFCPIIGFEGSKMKAFDTEKMLGQLKRVYVERVVRNGFEDGYLYNEDLMKLNAIELKEFENLKEIIGTTKAMAKTNEIDINKLGLTEEEYEEINKPQPKKHELTPEEEDRRKKLLEAKKNRDAAVSILRGISIRMPLLIYGADLNKNLDGTEDAITLDNFTDIVDDLSWEEFMPAKVTKDIFKKFKKYYDQDVFREAGIKIRDMVKAADNLRIEERIERIGSIFNTFRNPDKETVLTPWRVVNMHMANTLGGWRFYDKEYNEPIPEPVFVNHDDVTNNIFKKNTHILEINSKSGLYALYCAYSVYKTRFFRELGSNPSRNMEQSLWKKVIKENIFVICKTPMAKSITKRTLAGFSNAKVNSHYFENLVNQLKSKPEVFIKTVSKANYWNQEGIDMKFDAIVGNPPYTEIVQKEDNNTGSSKQIFPDFIITSINLNPKYVSLITPSRWFVGGEQAGYFPKLRNFLKERPHMIQLTHYTDYEEIFKRVNIPGGINYFLYSKDYNGQVNFIIHSNGKIYQQKRNLFEKELDIVLADYNLYSILKKVKDEKFSSMMGIIGEWNSFGIVGKKEFLEKATSLEHFNNSIKVQCSYEQIRFIKPQAVPKNQELITKWKVFTSKGNGGAGTLQDSKPVSIIGKSYVAEPNSICTDSLIPVGKFDTKTEAINCRKYMATKFLRFMVGILKVSQNIYRNVYQFVPLQDFTSHSDINWSKPIPEIDKQLYKKYKLSEDEITFIESKVKEME